MQRCGDAGGVSKKGAPCSQYMNLSPTTGMCLMHDPERAAQRRETQVAGAVAKGAAMRAAKAALPEDCPPAPKTIADAEKFASWLTYSVCIGRIDARTAHEASVCLKEFRGAHEKRVLESEVRALRRELAAAKGAAKHGSRTT
jgi:hypothetical protein